jgi:6-phosphogluconolactonase (cycloisomerase 2 family)
MAVLIGGLASRATTYDSSGYQLGSAYGVHALSVGGSTYVYATGLLDDGLSVFKLGANGSLTNVQNIDDGPTNGALKLKGASSLTSATVGGTTYLYAAGSIDDGISVFKVASNGTLINIQNVADTAALELNGIEGKMAVATVGTSTFLVATGDDDNGLSVFRIGADGRLTNTYNVTDAGALELDNALDAVTAVVGGSTFVFVAGEDDDGLSAFRLTSDGKLANTFNVTDNATLELNGAAGLATAVVGGATYLIASGGLDDGLSVFSVSGTGQLANVFNISDSAARGLNGAQGLTTFALDGETFLAVSGRDDDAVSLFQVGSGGKLTDVTAVFDSAGLALNGTFYNTFASVGGSPLLIASGFSDNGLSTFEIGGGADVLTGAASADLLLGLAGNDVLKGLGGADTLKGGSGLDDFVYAAPSDSLPGAGRDIIADFAKGSDDIVLTAIDANATLSGNQAFALDADGSFSVGEIRQSLSGSNLLLEFNTDADTAVEMAILLQRVTSPLLAADFEL